MLMSVMVNGVDESSESTIISFPSVPAQSSEETVIVAPTSNFILSIVLIFGRPVEINLENIFEINISSVGVIQSVIATILVLMVGSIPLLIIRSTI